MNRKVMSRLGSVGLLSAVLVAPLAAAADEPARGEGTTLDEVVVTAQKRIEDVQHIGLAVTAMSGKEIDTLRIKQPLDLANVSPSLSTMNAQTDITPLFLIRGVGLDDFNNNNSSGVGTYLDGVFASFPGFLTGAIYDIDRVEILKGPQGTLYGKNTAGGAINIISNQPTDDLSGYIDADYSRWDTVDLTAAVGGPIADGVTARLAATMTKQGEGYQTDIDTGQKFGRLNRGGGRLLVDFRPSSRVSLLINLHAVYDDSVPSSPSTPDVEALIPPQPFPTAGLLDSPPGGTLVRTGGLPLYRHDIGDGASATLNVQFNGFALTSITAWDYFTDHSQDNYDGYPGADNNYTKNFQQWQFSQEVRLASTTTGRVDWIVGADYSQNWYRNRDSLDWTFVYGLATSITDTGKAITAANLTQTQQSEGVFVHADAHLTSQWTLVAGLRYSHDEVSFDGVTIDPTGLLTYAANGFTGPIIPNTVLAALDQSRSSQNVSFRAEVDYRPTPKILVYASVASGYKGGIFYGQPAQTQADWGYVQPETELTSELGIKSRFLNDSMEFDAAAFDTDIRNRQSSLSLWSGPVGTQPLIAGLGNLPRSRIDGAEADFEWRPLSGLEINLAATYLYGRVTQILTNENGLALFNPVVPGQMLPDAPKFDGTWRVRYERPVSAKLVAYVQANDHYVGVEHPYLGDPTSFGNGDDLGARIGIMNLAQHWDASLWGTNLTDNRYLTYAFAGSEGQRVSFYQRPRSIGVNLVYSF